MNIWGKTIAVSALLAASASVNAQDSKTTIAATEVTPGLYMLEGVGGFVGGNMGLSIGPDGVVLMDNGLSSSLGLIKEAIAGLTDKQVDFLVNTHIHGDHMGNNIKFGSEGSRIIAHENLRKSLVENGMPRSGGKPAPKASLPVITFGDAVSFHLNGDDMRVFHVEKAHTDGDAVIYFKKANVIHTGDAMFNGLFPYIDYSHGGSLDGYINAQKTMHELADDNTKIIPGHGPIASKQDLKAAIDMLEDVKGIVGKLMAEGKEIDEILEINPLSKYHDAWNWGFITTERMTRQVYQGIRQG